MMVKIKVIFYEETGRETLWKNTNPCSMSVEEEDMATFYPPHVKSKDGAQFPGYPNLLHYDEENKRWVLHVLKPRRKRPRA